MAKGVSHLHSNGKAQKLFSQTGEVVSTISNAIPFAAAIVHANLSMSSISLSKDAHSRQSESRSWILSELSCSATCVHSPSNMAAGVTPRGYRQYATGTLPPELFAKLSPAELDLYEKYWMTVETQFGIKVDKKAIAPSVDIATGQAYVVKCHFLPISHLTGIERNSAPRLPYELVPISTSLDLWAFGLILFQLYAGRPLFPTDGRTGHLLAYHDRARPGVRL
jgi:serine/threonine protein kinase